MKVISRADEMISLAKSNQEKTIGFAPTMGALHKGHMSLVHRSLKENDITVVSIFVNPTQFNDPKDFDRYPREVEQDLQLALEAGVDYAFVPSKEEVYPEKDNHQYDLGEVANVLEGSFRPGHFNGVASVVKRLFELVRPHRAYFGLKDYQQYRVIQQLNENYSLGVEVIGCETTRDADGLAMSSRNQLLSTRDRKLALNLHKSLKLMAESSQGMENSDLEELAKNYLLGFPEIEVEYVRVVDPLHLREPLNAKAIGERLALLAAKIGKVRLIDNMKV